MSSLLSDLEGQGLVLPDRKAYPLEIARQFAKGKGDLVGDREKKVLLFIDGFGYDTIDSIIRKRGIRSELLERGRLSKLTTIFPSTTPNILGSTYSGMKTTEHGMLTTDMPLKDDRLVHVFKWIFTESGKVVDSDPFSLWPQPQLVREMRDERNLLMLTDDLFINTTITRAMFDSERASFATLEELLAKIVKAVKEGEHRNIYAYYDRFDYIQHSHSPDSEEAAELIKDILASIDRILLPALKGSGYDLIVTSDHGQTTINGNDTLYINPGDELMRYLRIPPWGDKRLRIFDVADGKEKGFEDLFAKLYGSHGQLFSSDELIRSGIFGDTKVAKEKRLGFGTHMLLANPGRMFIVNYPGRETVARPVSGQHAGLTPREMYIPLVVY